MKYSIFVKILAVLLCAASLMGIVGGAAGALVLVESDLYNKTVDDVITQRVQNLAAESANAIGSHYANTVLGGCPAEVSRSSGWNSLSRNFGSYGYAIVDAEGTVLASLNPELKDSAEVYALPVTGQYMHLVSTETEAQQQAKEAEARLNLMGRGMEVGDGKVIPPEGLSINEIYFTDAMGNIIYEAYGDRAESYSTYYYPNGYTTSSSTQHHQSQGRIGFLFCGPDGQMMYHSFLEEWENDFSATEVCGIMLLSHDTGFSFSTKNPDGLGVLVNEGGYLKFVSYLPEADPAAEVIPETTAATIPETLPEESIVQTEATEVTEETEEYTEETAEYTEEAEEYAEESEEYTEETTEYTEEGEPSSASAEPEEENTESWEETYTEETQEEEEIDWDYYDYKAEERLTYEWLLVNNLITEKELPDDLISDEDLHYWLVEYELIDPSQTIPDKNAIPEETVPEVTTAQESVPAETVPEIAEPVIINGKPLESYQINRTEYFDSATDQRTTARFVYLPMPEMTVEVYVDRDTMHDAETYNVLRMVRQYRHMLLPVIGISLLLFILSAVYLCFAAGRKPHSAEVAARGMNVLPLDLYLGSGIFLGIAFAAAAFAGVPVLLRSDFLLGCSLALAVAFVDCLMFVGFCFAFVAQVKTGGGYWWRNSLSARFIFLCMRFMQWLEQWLRETCFPGLCRCAKKTWQLTWKLLVRLYEAVEKVTAHVGLKLERFFSLIPMTWQWLLGGLTIILFSLLVNTHHIFLILLGILVPIFIVMYATHCFGILSESAKRMGKGNLETKVVNKLMVGCFRDFANDLNDLADVANVAAQKQLKSERMKTELITNVSHDIKTPLTSIINYVDLLQKPHTEEDEAQYLEVLDRQSQRLKKLVEDLMDMSKASTGNMAVEISRLDAVESVNQALGEFADKLERARLYPVFRHSEASVPIMADGKLVWRVLSNVLSNVVKYAMPGTRIYLDLTHVNGKVILSVKNISREELNVNAEELMERFVRGDISRNTEGSGLGLNIAKSLMELQKGQLQLLVDGDLFKVTLIFPDAR